MRKSIVFLVILASVVLAADTASALFRRLQGRYSSAAILAACNRAGGIFSGGAIYGCVVINCDHAGGDCTISCSNRVCTATTPGRVRGGFVDS